MQPELPLIKLAVQWGVAYLVIYKSEWIPAVKNDKARLIKEHIAVLITEVLSVVSVVMAVQAMLTLRVVFSGLCRTQRLRRVFKRGCLILFWEENILNYSQGNAVCSKVDVNSKTISARDSQQSSHVAKLICNKVLMFKRHTVRLLSSV